MDSKLVSGIFWLLLIIGISGFIMPSLLSGSLFNFYKTALELSLFGFSAFLVFKRVFYYRIKEDVEVIRLIKRSDYYAQFLWYGVLLALIYLVYIRNYDNLLSFNTILIAILLLYYLVQIILHANPSVYIDSRTFSYDNYFVEEWHWKDLKRIEIGEDKIRLISNKKDFELDLNTIDEIDYVKITDEVERNVLDGYFGNEQSSKTLLEIIETYANAYGVQLEKVRG